ncbi:MAG: hypothetical protein PHH82_04010 [Candidatus ainarchaeum sp.]|nr:hypothetical protein [Candidatus ainarchaeum sp.]
MNKYFIVIIFCVLFAACSYSYTWSLTQVEAIGTGTAGYPYLLKMDVTSDGIPNLIYRNNSGSNLRHAYYSSGSWTIANIGAYNPQYIWACMDPSDNLHVSYYDLTSANRDMRYLKWTDATSSWQASPTIVDQSHTVIGQYSSIASDSSGNLGLAYLDYYSTSAVDDLYYAYYNGSWATTGIDVNASEKDGYNTAIVFDSSGFAHIVYCDNTNYDLKYATNSSGSWVISRVDTSDVCWGNGVGLAIDTSDNLYACYWDRGGNFTQDLKFAYYNGSWSTETAASTDVVGKYCSIDVNSSGVPHISHFNDTDNTLEMAYKVESTWYTEVVDTNSNSGIYGTSLKIDADNNVHIGYLINPGTSGFVGYAFAAGPVVPVASYFDVNYTTPTSGNYNTEVQDVEFYSTTSDPSTGLNLKIYVSSSQGGFETELVDLNVLDYANISGMSCVDSNFQDSTRCVYDLNVVGVTDGNYYIDLNLYNTTTSSTDSSTGTLRIDHTAPTISSVSMNSESQLTGSNYALTATISDAGSGLDGNEIYICWSPSSSEVACTSGSWDCHLGDMVNTAGNSYSATISASVKDTSGVWNCKIYATDVLGLSNSGTDTETMQTTTGITVDAASAIYSGNPNTTENDILTDQAHNYLVVTHNGNSSINVDVNGNPFTSGGNIITPNLQKFKNSDDYGSAVSMTGSSQRLITTWGSGSYPTSDNFSMWFWLDIPVGAYHGDYSSSIVFTSEGS